MKFRLGLANTLYIKHLIKITPQDKIQSIWGLLADDGIDTWELASALWDRYDKDTLTPEEFRILEQFPLDGGDFEEDYFKNKIIELEKIKKLTVKKFFRLIKGEIENILDVKINYRELSKEYLTSDNKKGGNKWYVNDHILDSLRFTDYVLPTASLNRFKRNLIEKFKEKSAYFEYIIDLYKDTHKWSLQLSKQPDIEKDGKTYFSKITTLEQAYYFGFLLAESHIVVKWKNKRFQLGINAIDGVLIKEFARAIGFDVRKVLYSRKSGKDGKTLRQLTIGFSSSKFYEDLVKYGFPESGKTSQNPELRFPYQTFLDMGLDKKFIMALLLGFFDGDGTHGLEDVNVRLSKKEETKLNPILKISNRQFLEDIKEYFEIESDVKEVKHKKGVFKLNIGKKLFNDLIKNYDKSLKRKVKEYTIRDDREKFVMPDSELEKLINRGWSYTKIAAYHKTIYDIEITYGAVRLHAMRLKLSKPYDPKLRWRASIQLLSEGFTLEKIYTKEFGYSLSIYSKQRFVKHFQKWFADDPKVKDSDGVVSLDKIIEVYGNLERPLIIDKFTNL